MSIEDNKALVRRYYEECNAIKGSPARARAMIDEFFAPDFVGHSPMGEMNSEQHKLFRVAQYNAFPDLNWTVDDIIAEEDKVVACVVTIGTHKGEYRGIPATGRQINVPGVDIFRISGGKFVELWSHLNTLDLMQ